jgi:hypothetical protein
MHTVPEVGSAAGTLGFAFPMLTMRGKAYNFPNDMVCILDDLLTIQYSWWPFQYSSY